MQLKIDIQKDKDGKEKVEALKRHKPAEPHWDRLVSASLAQYILAQVFDDVKAEHAVYVA